MSNLIVSTAFGFGMFLPVALVAENNILAGILAAISGVVFFIYMTLRSGRQSAESPKKVNENVRTYNRRFAIAMGSYCVLLIISVYALNRTDQTSWRWILALLPVVPVLYGVWAYMEWLRNLDEFQQKIQLEAIAFSLAMTGVFTFTVGFLQVADLVTPDLGLIWVFPIMIMFWGVGQFIAMRRYE